MTLRTPICEQFGIEVPVFLAGMGDGGGGLADVCGFAALAAVGDGGEVGGVGFDHEGTGRAAGRGIKNRGRVLEGGDAGERDESTERQDRFGLGEVAGKAVEDGAGPGREGGVDGKGILKRVVPLAVAGVNHDVETEFGGELEVLSQEIPLPLTVSIVRPAIGGGVEIVESGFAEGRDIRVRGKVPERAKVVIRSLMHIAGVDADAGKDPGKALRNAEVDRNVLQIGGQRHEPVHPGLRGPRH